MAVDAHGMPVRIIVTEGARADCTQAQYLIEGIPAEFLLASCIWRPVWFLCRTTYLKGIPILKEKRMVKEITKSI